MRRPLPVSLLTALLTAPRMTSPSRTVTGFCCAAAASASDASMRDAESSLFNFI